MRSFLGAVLLLALSLITSVPSPDAFAGDLPSQLEPLPPAVGGDDVDIKLPVTSPLTAQWIIVVDGGQMQILPATARKEEGGTVISAAVPHLSSQSLRGAVATAQDGNIISTALHAAKK